MDISARAFSLADRPRLDHLGHQCSHALGRPNLHLVSSSRRPRLEAVDRVTSSLAPRIAQFLCSSQGPFLRPGPQNVDRVARRGGNGRTIPLAVIANGHRERPQLPKVTPGLAGVASFSTLNANVSPARISFTACPLTSAWRNAASKLSLSFTCQIAPARAEYVCCWLMTLSE